MASQVARRTGTNVRALRKAKGLNQRELAALLGVESFQVSRWERGAHSPSRLMLAALCAALDCTENDLHAPSPDDDQAAA